MAMAVPTESRADRNNNPTAMTTGVAWAGGLKLGVDYEQGDAFTAGGNTYYTAKLLGDPLALTIRVIDTAGFYTTPPTQRWSYIALPFALWGSLTPIQKAFVIGWMYGIEGGVTMKGLFPTAPG
jgi:hypothetical protein